MTPEYILLALLGVGWIVLAFKLRGACAGHNMEPLPDAEPTLVDGGPIRVIEAYNPENSMDLSTSLFVQEYTVSGCQHDGCLHTEQEWQTVETYQPDDAPEWVQDAAIPKL